MTDRPSSQYPSQYLFVYGSLRQDHPECMYRLLQPGSRFVCKASLGAQLIDTKDYPGVIDSADENCRVSGELHRLDDPATVLARTDAWEGCTPDDPQPHEYERVIRDVKCDDGRCTPAWVYLYRGPVPAG